MRKLIIALILFLIVFALLQRSDFVQNSPQLSQLFRGKPTTNAKNTQSTNIGQPVTQQVIVEESTITNVIEKSLPSVVTIGIKKTINSQGQIQIDPFDPFGGFRRIPGRSENIERNIGSGFIITDQGLIITNKHVVSDQEATYQVLTNDKKKFDVQKIYRDPLNDLAILKVDASNLPALPLGDSEKLKLGQTAIAIGTPLGEFTNTVTTGIVSGLGRGITAGSPYEGFVEKLDNVIQTDAAISPGNSGGPLLNSAGQVIGVNTAVSAEGQNIGFAIPVNIVKDLINTFNRNGGVFERPYIGVRYQMVDRNTALQNKVVEGGYVIEVVKNSPADKAGIQEEDIITEFDGKTISGNDDQVLTKAILNKKIGESVNVKLWRNGQNVNVNIQLEAYNQ